MLPPFFVIPYSGMMQSKRTSHHQHWAPCDGLGEKKVVGKLRLLCCGIVICAPPLFPSDLWSVESLITEGQPQLSKNGTTVSQGLSVVYTPTSGASKAAYSAKKRVTDWRHAYATSMQGSQAIEATVFVQATQV